jgi:hypothetical protein
VEAFLLLRSLFFKMGWLSIGGWSIMGPGSSRTLLATSALAVLDFCLKLMPSEEAFFCAMHSLACAVVEDLLRGRLARYRWPAR